MPPRVLAIVVNWNKRDFLDQLLRDMLALERPPDTVLVVDNASTDGSPALLRERYPQVELLETGANLGGSGGFNAGMRWGLGRGGYDYFWLCDNDIVVHPGALEALLTVAEAEPRAALVGSRIAELGRPDRTQEVGARVEWDRCTLVKLGMHEEFGPPGDLERARVFEADYGAACSLLARVRAVREVGIWDPGYFVFFDDIEWGIRFRRAGWKVLATSASLVEHDSFHERRLTHGPWPLYLSLRNGIFFMHGFAPARRRPLLLLRVFHGILVDNARYRRDGRNEVARARRLAVRDFFQNVRGKPPRELPARDYVRRRLEADPSGARDRVPRRHGRLLFWSQSAAPATLAALERLRRDYPEHRIDLFVPSERIEARDFGNEQPIRRPFQGRRARIALWRWISRHYDTVIHDEKLPRLYFEDLLPCTIWYDAEGRHCAVAQRPWDLALTLLQRPFLIAGALALTAAALVKPRTRVDYFDWKDETPPDAR